MTLSVCKNVWEDLVINHSVKNAQEKLQINNKDINFITNYTMPEMFIGSELNKVHKKRKKELEQEYLRLDKMRKQKKRNIIIYKIMLFSYAIIMFPILAIFAYIMNS